MLAKINRLKKEKDFKKIYKFGGKRKGNFFIIRYQQNRLSSSRFGFVMPASVIKKAIKRNLFKRKTSEIIRLNLEKIKSGYDIIILVFRPPTQEEYQFLEKEILSLIKKADLYIKND